MNQIDKYLNHIIWLLNALKEHIQIINKNLTHQNKEKEYILNANYQKVYYCFTLFIRLEKNIEKGYKLLLTSNKVNKKSLTTLKNVYLNRCKIQLDELLFHLRNLKLQIGNSNYFMVFINSEIKNIASLLNILESDMNFLITNIN